MTSRPKVFTSTSENDPEIIDSQDEIVNSWSVISSPSTSSGSPDHDTVVPSNPVQIAGQPGPDNQSNRSELVAGNNGGNPESQTNQSIMIVPSSSRSKSGAVSNSSIVVLEDSMLPPPPTHYSCNKEGEVVVCGSLLSSSIQEPLNRNLSIESYGSGQGQPSNDDREADSPTNVGDGTTPDENGEFSEKAESNLAKKNDESLLLDGLLEELEASKPTSNSIENPDHEKHTKIADQTTNTATMGQSESPMPTGISSPSKVLVQSESVTGASFIENDEESTASLPVAATGSAQGKEANGDGHMDYVKPESMAKPHSNLVQDNNYLMVQPNGDVKEYIHDSLFVDETTPLLHQRSSRGIRRRKLRHQMIIWCVIGWLFIILLAGLGAPVVLYEMGVFAYNNNTNETLPVFQNESVFISYSNPRTYLYSRAVTVTSFTNTAELQSYIVNLFLLDKRKLSETIQTLDLAEHIPRTKFDICPNFTCALNFPPLYLATTGNGESHKLLVTLNVSIDSSTSQSQSNIYVMAFDDLKYIKEFLATGDISNGIKIKSTSSNNHIFELTSDDLKKSGYVYFAIQRFNGTSEWFSAQLSGVRTYYNTSSLTPHCTMDEANRHLCVISGLDDDTHEILVRVDSSTDTTEYFDWPSSIHPYYIRYSISHLKPNTFGQLVVGGGFIVILVVLVVMVCTCCCLYCYRRNRYTRSSQHQQIP